MMDYCLFSRPRLFKDIRYKWGKDGKSFLLISRVDGLEVANITMTEEKITKNHQNRSIMDII
jgi:hypothetical protein